MERVGDSKIGKASIILLKIALLSIISKLSLFIIGVFLPVYSSIYGLEFFKKLDLEDLHLLELLCQ